MHRLLICQFRYVFGRLFRFDISKYSMLLLALISVLILAGYTATAQSADSSVYKMLSVPKGRVVIEVTGNIAATNGENSARFDYEMLEQLGLVEITVDTPWTEPNARFEGVLTRKLLEMVGADGTEVIAEAADGYSVSMPISDLTEFDTLLALSMDGKRMRLRNKGPAWIIYNAEDRPEVIDTMLNSRMVWQLLKLVVK